MRRKMLREKGEEEEEENNSPFTPLGLHVHSGLHRFKLGNSAAKFPSFSPTSSRSPAGKPSFLLETSEATRRSQSGICVGKTTTCFLLGHVAKLRRRCGDFMEYFTARL